jgi:hypothetical protein
VMQTFVCDVPHRARALAVCRRSWRRLCSRPRSRGAPPRRRPRFQHRLFRHLHMRAPLEAVL